MQSGGIKLRNSVEIEVFINYLAKTNEDEKLMPAERSFVQREIKTL